MIKPFLRSHQLDWLISLTLCVCVCVLMCSIPLAHLQSNRPHLVDAHRPHRPKHPLKMGASGFHLPTALPIPKSSTRQCSRSSSGRSACSSCVARPSSEAHRYRRRHWRRHHIHRSSVWCGAFRLCPSARPSRHHRHHHHRHRRKALFHHPQPPTMSSADTR